MNSKLKVLVVLGFILTAVGCMTPEKEVPKVAGISLFPPLQLPGKESEITGGRTSILWGKHDVVKGGDVGFVGNITEKEFQGTAFALGFNSTKGKADIVLIQFAGLTNISRGKTRVFGVQLAGGVNYNGGDQSVFGAQIAGLGNIGFKNNIYGIQLGLYNEAEHVYGFQIGVINRTKNLHGIQIGAINLSSKNGLPFCPVINIGF